MQNSSFIIESLWGSCSWAGAAPGPEGVGIKASITVRRSGAPAAPPRLGPGSNEITRRLMNRLSEEVKRPIRCWDSQTLNLIRTNGSVWQNAAGNGPKIDTFRSKLYLAKTKKGNI